MAGRTHCTALMWGVLALSVTCLFSCYKSETATCSSGRVCPSGLKCSLEGNTCIADQCGDGIRQKAGERCDDGNTESGDGCSADCLSLEICGDGVKNEGEVCDDGNRNSGDGCSADCLSDETCGNTIIDFSVGEVCDDGNNQSSDKCSADCKSLEICGNGIQDVNEDCDSPDRTICSPNCKALGICRNGMLEAGEECDDGNDIDTDTCRNDCRAAKCGDGFRDPGEECDPGATADGPVKCTSECKPSRCGDKFVNKSADEECDTGKMDKYCTDQCRFSYCGDKVLNLEAEECDASADPTLNCTSDCKKIVGTCGDGVENRPEKCDDGNASACGRCSEQCLIKQDPLKAKGTLMLVGNVAEILDGWRFSIGDGYVVKMFEFDLEGDPNGGQVTGGNIQVYVKNGETLEELTQLIQILINLDTSELALHAEDPVCSASACTMVINHQEEGSIGNHPIRIGEFPIGNSLGKYLKVTGMSGGRAWDCTRGVKCLDDKDCLRELKCIGPTNGQKCCGGCD